MELGRAHRTVLAIFSIALKAEVIFFHAYAGGLRTPREMHRFWSGSWRRQSTRAPAVHCRRVRQRGSGNRWSVRFSVPLAWAFDVQLARGASFQPCARGGENKFSKQDIIRAELEVLQVHWTRADQSSRMTFRL